MQFSLQAVGKITKPHGFKGHLQVKLFKSLKSNWFKEPVFLVLEEQPVPFFIEEFTPKNNGNCVLKFNDCNNEQQAFKFKGLEVWLKDELIEEKNDPSYLLNWRIKDIPTNKTGIICGVVQNPMQWLIQVQIEGKEVLIPLVDEFISEINERQRTLFLTLPEGLLDIYL